MNRLPAKLLTEPLSSGYHRRQERLKKPALATAEIPNAWGKATAKGDCPGFVSAF